MTTAKEAIATALGGGEKPAPFGATHGGHPDYRANLEKLGRIGFGRKGYGACETEACAFCGKYTANPKFHAFMKTGGSFDVFTTDEELMDNAWIGFYPLGSDCAAKLKKHVPVYKLDDGPAKNVGAS